MKALVLVLAMIVPAALLGQEVQRVGSTAVFVWDAVTTDIEGNPETIGAYEVAAFPPGTVLNPTTGTAPVPLATVKTAGDVTRAAALLFLASFATGTPIRVSVRAVDAAGNVSEWADPVDVVVDFKRPKKPNRPWWAWL